MKHLYRSAFQYIWESRAYIYAVVALFLASGLFGFVYSADLAFLDSFLRELLEKTRGLPLSKLIFFIFLNNIESSLVGLLLGLFFGIIPVLVTLLNGSVIGYVLAKSWYVSGISDFWRLLPHGIFELPAIFVSLGLGIRLGFFVTEKDKRAAFIDRLYHSLLVFACIIVPMLAIAAVIEGLLIIFLTY